MNTNLTTPEISDNRNLIFSYRDILQRVKATIFSRGITEYIHCYKICSDLSKIQQILEALSGTNTGYINEIAYFFLVYSHELIPGRNYLRKITFSILEQVAKEKEFVFDDCIRYFYVEATSIPIAIEILLRDHPSANVIKCDNFAFYSSRTVQLPYNPCTNKPLNINC